MSSCKGQYVCCPPDVKKDVSRSAVTAVTGVKSARRFKQSVLFILTVLMLLIGRQTAFAADLYNPLDATRSFSSIWGNDQPGFRHGASILNSTQAWSAARNDLNQWIELPVDAGLQVVAVKTQGRRNYDQWVTGYQLQARLQDGRLIDLRNGDTLAGNTDRNGIVTHAVQAPQGTTAIRLLPRQWYRHISLRIALETTGSAIQYNLSLIHI